MTTVPIPAVAIAKLAELSGSDRLTTAREVAELLEAWGFVPGPRVDPGQPELAILYYHPSQPHLHMSLPSHGALVHRVTQYAVTLVGSVQTP